MTREELIDALASVRGRVDSLSRETVARVIAMAEKYRYLGKDFSFDTDRELRQSVLQLLIILSDDILDYSDKVVEGMDEDERDALLLWAHREQGGKTPEESVDSHSSHLFFIIEAWLAIGFVNKLSQGEILADIFAYPDPFTNPLWKNADGYASTLLQGGKVGWGRGVARNPVDGFSLVGENIINMAYQRDVIFEFARDGAIGYRIIRGSDYDCPLCDSYVGPVYPLDEIILPLHPRCVCIAVPVYPE